MPKRRHVYALFDDRQRAQEAYDELHTRGCAGEHCNVIMQEQVLEDEDLPLGQTAAREGAVKGAIIVSLVGATALGALGGLLGAGLLIPALLGAGVGAAYGGMFGSISGSSDPAKALREIEAQIRAGKVLVAVETDDAALEGVCETVFEAHGGVMVGA